MILKQLFILFGKLRLPLLQGLAAAVTVLVGCVSLAYTLTRWGLGNALGWTALLVGTLIGALLVVALAELIVKSIPPRCTEAVTGIAGVLIILTFVVGLILGVILLVPVFFPGDDQLPAPVRLTEVGDASEAPARQMACHKRCRGACCNGTCRPAR
jgi:hypothetical protein